MSSPTVSTITPIDDAGLTDKEIKLLASAWLASASTDLDIDKFAAIAGYPSPVNARKRFGEAKNRARAKIFGSATGSASPDNAGAPLTPKTPKKASPKTPKANTKRKSPASGSDSAGSGGSSPKRGRTLKREDEEASPSAEEAAPSIEVATK